MKKLIGKVVGTVKNTIVGLAELIREFDENMSDGETIIVKGILTVIIWVVFFSLTVKEEPEYGLTDYIMAREHKNTVTPVTPRTERIDANEDGLIDGMDYTMISLRVDSKVKKYCK